MAGGLDPGCPPSPELVAAVAAGDLGWLPGAAVFHGVAPALHLALGRVPETPEPVRRTLERSFHGTVSDHLRTLEDVALLEAVLREAGVPWLVLKGPVLGELYYEPPDVRPYSDLDVLVGAGAFGDAVAALEAAGCRVAQEWPEMAGGPPGEMQLALPSGRALDLHWHLVNSPRVRRRFAVATAPLFERARPVTVGRTRVMTLGPADTLAHLLLHGWLSGGDRLVWMKDVAVCAAREGAGTVEQARTVAEGWGAGLVADAYVQRVRATFDGGAPRCLDPAPRRRRSLWLGVSRLADLTTPVAGRDGGPTLARVLARSTRGDDRASVAELARKARLNLAERLPRALRRGPADETEPTSTAAERRRAFLVAVERAGDGWPSEARVPG
jgi:hypothetical protein